MNKKLVLIDGNSILNRAFYGVKTENILANSKGVYTNAVFGFLNILNKYLEEENPTHLAVAFDVKKPTFRHLKYSEYKANRKGMPPELAMQLPIIKKVLAAMKIETVVKEGFEADDIIGTLAKSASKEDYDVVILTGDRDAIQLVEEKINILIPTSKMGKTNTDRYDIEAVKEKYGIAPEQLIDVKGLMGDKSDNIPGVAGVGEKTALELIKKYGSLENTYENIEDITKAKLKEKLINDKELAVLSKELGRIDINVQELPDISSFEKKEMDKEKLYLIFKELEFNVMINRYNLEGAAAQDTICIDTEIVYDFNKIIEYCKDSSLEKLYFLCESGKDGFPTSITVKKNNAQAIYFDIQSEIESMCLFSALKGIFEDENIAKTGFGMKSIISYLKNLKIEINGDIFDSEVAAYVLDPSKNSYSIEKLSYDLCGKIIKIEGVDSEKERANRQGTYVTELPDIEEKIREKISENQQEYLLYNVEFPLINILADMEYNGFKIDKDMLKEIGEKLDKNISELTAQIYEYAGEEFNINSPKQLGTILFEKLQLPIGRKTKTGYSTDAETLEKLKDKHPIIPLLLEYRQDNKFKTTYVDGLFSALNRGTGKIHSVFNQTVTTTGRISSSEPNMQNIPTRTELGREFRKVFIPSTEDYVILDADYSQIELRILAHVAEDQDMIDAFANGEDIHAVTASKVFNVPLEEVDSDLRGRAKAVNFGIVYGISSYGLARDLSISPKEAKGYIDEYFEKYSSVKKYLDETVAEAKEKGYVSTILNRRRYIPEIKSSNFNVRSLGERLAMNTPIQGSAADIIKVAMVLVYNKLKGMKSKLILQVHDELLIETHKDEVEEVKVILKECMEGAFELKSKLVADVNQGNNWYQAK